MISDFAVEFATFGFVVLHGFTSSKAGFEELLLQQFTLLQQASACNRAAWKQEMFWYRLAVALCRVHWFQTDLGLSWWWAIREFAVLTCEVLTQKHARRMEVVRHKNGLWYCECSPQNEEFTKDLMILQAFTWFECQPTSLSTKKFFKKWHS